MPIVIATCSHCSQPVEIDTTYAIVLTGTPETVWRIIKAHYRVGDQIDTRIVADLAFVNRGTVYRALKRLVQVGLITPQKVRRNHHYLVAQKYPAKLTHAIRKIA